MRNTSHTFGFLTQNSSLVHFWILVFQGPMEMRIEGIRVRYAEFIISPRILKDGVDIK